MPAPSSNLSHGFLARLKWHYLDSLKGRLIALSLGLSLSLLWALVFFSTSFQQQKFSEVLFDHQLAAARRLAANITGELQERVAVLTLSATRLPDDLTPRTLDDHLPRLAALQLAFTGGSVVIGMDGRVIADYPVVPGRRGMDVSDRDYFRNVVDTGKPAIATLVTERTSQRPTLVIAVPVLDRGGKMRAILAGTTDLSAPNFLGFVFERKMAGKGQFYVTSPRHRLVLASTEPDRVLTATPAPGEHAVYDRFTAGFEGSTIARNTHGMATLFSATAIPMANWLVTATYPAEVAFRPVTTMRDYLITMAAILTLLAIGVAHWMTRRLLAPLEQASQAMQRMAQDGASLAPLEIKGKGEIGGIIQHFNHLVEDHQHRANELAISQQRLEAIVRNASDAIFVHTRGYFVYLNAVALRLFGADSQEQLLGQSILTRIHPDSRPAAQERIDMLSAGKENVPAKEMKFLRMDGSIVYVRSSGILFNYENDDSSLTFVRDITDRKLAELALQKSEERFRRLVALSSEWYWEHDERFVMTEVAGWKGKQGGSIPRYGIGKSGWEMVLEADDPFWQTHRATVEARRSFTDLEHKVQKPDGSTAWHSVSGEPVYDENGNYKGYRGTGRDITERKQAEEALRQSRARIRELAAHQETIKERERKRIARDLHDELGQTLLAIRLDAATLAEKTIDTHPGHHEAARLMLDHIDLAMKSVKAVINDLRPFVLDLGLVAAMEWQISEFQRRSGIECVLDVDDEDVGCHLDEHSSTALFRVLQESLTNIARHAKANHVQVTIRADAGQLVMMIADDGIGIALSQRPKKRAFGLVGIEERIKTIGGTFAVDSAPGKGTTLFFFIPLSVSIEAAC